MKKYIANILIFFALIAVVDFSFGFVCEYLNKHAKGGDTKSHYYIARECKEDLLIFGSSRALHHYVPSIIKDSLGVSAYNCAWDGNGIISQYGRLLIVLGRYTPKVILYDVYSEYDLLYDDKTKYLGLLKSFYDSPDVDDIFFDVSPNEKYKMYSKLYRYNSSFASMVMDNLHPLATVLDGGYKPNYGSLKYNPDCKENSKDEDTTWDPLKKKYMQMFIDRCKEKNIKLLFLYSPMYKDHIPAIYSQMTEFAKDNNVPVLDYYSDNRFQNINNFSDPSHLNDAGAKYYTKVIINNVKHTLLAY